MTELLHGYLDLQHSRPGYAALVVVAALAVGVFFLVRSFLKHEKKAREPWDDDSA